MILVPDADMETVGIDETAPLAKFDDRLAVGFDMGPVPSQRHAIDRGEGMGFYDRLNLRFDMAHQRGLVDGEFEKTFLRMGNNRRDRFGFHPLFQRFAAIGEFDRKGIRRLSEERVSVKIGRNRSVRLKGHPVSARYQILDELGKKRLIGINERLAAGEDDIDMAREAVTVHDPDQRLKLLDLLP